jgi:hypothetical protein
MIPASTRAADRGEHDEAVRQADEPHEPLPWTIVIADISRPPDPRRSIERAQVAAVGNPAC